MPPGQSAAPTAIPGLVLSTTIDGHLRAYGANDGKIEWDFDTAAQKYQTINGVKDQGGGSLDVAGPVLAGGLMYIISGYAGAMGGSPNKCAVGFFGGWKVGELDASCRCVERLGIDHGDRNRQCGCGAARGA